MVSDKLGAIQSAIRELIDEVIIYPNDDREDRDVELVGDIEALFLPPRGEDEELGMEAMVPGGGIEPPTREISSLAAAEGCLGTA